MLIKTIISLKKKHRTYLYLFLIIIAAFYLRTFNINWDNNYYFHPDERAIIMFASPLKLPSSINEFLSIQSPLNPHFFAYGNFPLYLVKLLGNLSTSINPVFSTYGGLHIIGRLISATTDTGTVFLVFLLGSALFSKRAGLIAGILYCLSVFPIQAAHFYAVDSLLTFFMTATILAIISFTKKPKFFKSLGIGLLLGLALATKISAAIMIIPIIIAFAVCFFIKKKKKIHLVISFFITMLSCLFVFFITQPYAFLDFNNYLQQISLQSQMSNNPFLFPYTLQYVGKIPYFYELKNMMLFGLGPISFLICTIGLFLIFANIKKRKIKLNLPLFLILFYFAFYFILFGKFSVGWMRYMLPIYPLLAIFGSYLISEIVIEKIQNKYLSSYIVKKASLLFFLILIGLYPLSFLAIYSHQNTRIQASDWINQNIPAGSSLAVEHWDDSLPVYGMEKYIQLTLPLYEPDTNEKWEQINATLNSTQYIVIASNRLYTPLQKLTDCNKLPSGRCYPRTSEYYKELFRNKLGFTKIVEFSNYPTVPFTKIKLVDDSADESFTVYDHPKIMIFKKD